MTINRKVLATNFLIVTVALLSIEIVCRNILNNKYNRAFDSSIIQPNKHFDSDGLKPNANAVVWGKKFTTDQFGFRSTGKPFDKKKKTWLFIGDSVTQGVGVDDSSTYVSLIAKSLDSMNVLNCSMIGWSVYDYKNVIESLLADSANPLNISKITIGWCLNDVYGKAKTSDLPAVGNKGWKSTVSAFLQEYYGTYRLLKLFATQNSDHYFKYDIQFYEASNEYFKEASNTLSEIQKIASEKQIAISVLILPYQSKNKHTIEYKRLLALMKANSSMRLDDFALQSDFKINNYLFADEIHFNAHGHKTLSNNFHLSIK